MDIEKEKYVTRNKTFALMFDEDYIASEKAEGEEDYNLIARIASYREPDKWGDIYTPGSVKSMHPKIAVYDFEHGRQPMGAGIIADSKDGKHILFKGSLHSYAAPMREHLQAMGGSQEWSWKSVTKAKDTEINEYGGLTYKRGVKAYEVSPVQEGVGSKTGTVSVKSAESEHTSGLTLEEEILYLNILLRGRK